MARIPHDWVLVDCGSCGPRTRATVRARVNDTKNYDEITVWTTHRIVECRGCGEIYHRIIDANSEDYEQDEHGQIELNETVRSWPELSVRRQPEWFDELSEKDDDLHSIMSEVYQALNARLTIVPAIGMRTAIDRAAEVLGVDPDRKFFEKIEDFIAAGHVRADEKEQFTTMIDAGGAAAHRGWKPSSAELDELMSALEAFIYRSLIAPSKIKQISTKVPPKPKKK